MNIIFVEKPDIKKRQFKQFKDLEGQIFSRLTVIGYAGLIGNTKNKKHSWYCQCSCENKTIHIVTTSHLKSNHTTSCGCYCKEATIKSLKTHGLSKSKEYATFYGAMARCKNFQNKNWEDYGGQGIEFKFNSFEEWFKELGNAPSPQHSVDRIDRNGHYEIGNVRWATPSEQALNRKTNRLLSLNGEIKSLKEWADLYKLSTSAIIRRIKRGWCDLCAISTPTKPNYRLHKCGHKG